MPFKSKAQRRKFAELLIDGKITDEQYEEWNRSTGKKDLPERIHPLKAGETGRTSPKKPTKRKAPAEKTTKKPTKRRTAAKKTTKQQSTKARARK